MRKNLLRAAMAKNEINIVELSKKIKISEASLRSRIKGEREFTLKEADRIGKVLQMDDKDMLEIFFNRVVS